MRNGLISGSACWMHSVAGDIEAYPRPCAALHPKQQVAVRELRFSLYDDEIDIRCEAYGRDKTPS